mmetsp:Transcript_114091/g.323049  ORF Transcript_114091/g.323049 Transcript_114091/m.323049 type:complete len:365 (-) Transcript_114091:282-1376(-)
MLPGAAGCGDGSPPHLVEQQGAWQRRHEEPRVEIGERRLKVRLPDVCDNVVDEKRESPGAGLGEVPAGSLPGALEPLEGADEVGVVGEVRVELVEAARVPLQNPPQAVEAPQQRAGDAQQHRRGAGAGAAAVVLLRWQECGVARGPARVLALVGGVQVRVRADGPPRDSLGLVDAGEVHVAPALAVYVCEAVQFVDLLHEPAPLRVQAHPVGAGGPAAPRRRRGPVLQLRQGLLHLDGPDEGPAGLAVDGLYLLQRRHLEAAPAPVEVHQGPPHVVADLLQGVGLQVLELPLQLLACLLEHELQRLALVEHGVGDIKLLAVEHVRREQCEGCQQRAVEVAAQLHVRRIMRAVALAHMLRTQRVA